MGDFAYPAIVAARRDPGQLIRGAPGTAAETIGDFWAWAYSDVLTNTTRGVLAEYLVAVAVGNSSGTRDPWAPYDVVTPSGVTIEVKSAAYVQSWGQRTFSKVSFGCRPTMPLDESTATYIGLAARRTQVWVFALLHHTDQSTIDPLETSQWTFWAMPTQWLDENLSTASSISLARLKSSPFGEPVAIAELARAVDRAATEPSSS